MTCEVAGPLGKSVSARMLVDGERESAVIEMAEAAGIGYSPCTESSALAATTYGVGELMLRAVRTGAKTLYIGLGGSAANDGGAGMLQALGARVVDDRGCDIAPGLAGLERVASVDLAPALRALDGARIVVLSDVENPLVGRRGALAVFGGQKGLPTGDAEALSRCDSWMVGYGRLLDTAIVEARARGCCAHPRAHGHLARCSACPARALPVAWARRCWHSVRSYTRVWRRCSISWGLTNMCAMSTWS